MKEIIKKQSIQKLKQATKTIVCLCLCLCLIVGYSYKKPAKAVATGIVVAGSVVVLGALAALGISFSTQPAVTQKFCDDIWNQIKDSVTPKVAQVSPDGGYNVQYTTNDLQRVATGFYVLYNSLWSSSDIVRAFPAGYKYNVPGYYNPSDLSQLFQINVMSSQGNNGKNWWNPVVIYVKSPSPSGSEFHFGRPDFYIRVVCTTLSNKYQYKAYTVYQGTESLWTTEESTYNRPAAVLQNGTPGYERYQLMLPYGDISGGYKIMDQYSMTQIQGLFSDVSLEKKNIYAQGKSILTQDQSAVIGAAYDKYRTQHLTADDQNMELHLQGNPSKVDAQAQAQTQTQVLNGSIADTADKAANDAANTGKDTSVPMPDMPDLSLPSMITKKFPFSLPWDMYNAISVLAAPGTAPTWDIPFEIQSLNFKQNIKIDFSQFEVLASIMRWGLSLMWIVILIFITRKMIWK